MVPRRPSHPLRPCRSSLSSIRTLAPLATLLLAPATAQAAQGTCGIAAGFFQVDGQFYSSAQYTDWAQGNLGTAVFANDGTSLITPSLRARDGHWGGHETDLDAFAGTGNKNNDDISAQADPWTWGKGSGPSKNDLTDVYASSAMVDGEVWLFLGANTRTNTGSSHVDFEISQAGFVRTGTQSGTIVGLGPHAGRTADVDFIVSVDYENGGGVPTVSLRTWRSRPGGYQFVQSIPSPGDVFICTNDQAVPAGPWGTIAPDGSVSTEVAPFQFVEIAVNLTNLGIDPSVYCSSPSTLMFKTRSSPSFTSTLKDLTMHPFSLVSPPPATITPGRAIYCVGDVATLCAPAQPSAGRYRYEWDGPGGPYAGAACIETGLAGTYQLVVHDSWSGCSAETSFELVLTELPIADITFDTDVICAGETAEFCGPAPRSGSAYAYAWSGPGGVRSDARCLQVSEAGVYRLTVTDLVTGCVSVPAEHSLTVNALPVATIAGTGAICAGTTTELCGPDGDYDYAWEGPGDALPNQRCITVSVAGTYQLTLRDRATGCVGLAAAHDLEVMPLPVAEITGPASFCPGTRANLCGPEGDLAYAWSGPNGALPSTRCITVDAAGTYTLTVENRAGCVSSITEHELTLEEGVVVTEMEDLFRCTGDRGEFCVEATGSGPFTYVWSKDGHVIAGATEPCFAIPSISAASAGEYAVEVSGRCDSVVRRATLTLADVQVAGLRDAYLCEGQPFELCPDVSGLGPFTYFWRNETRGFVTSDQSCLTIDAVGAGDEGIYTLTVTGQCGDPVVVEFRVRVGRCEQFCSKSQGFWGNDGGAWNGERVPQLLDAIITTTDPIVLGAPSVRSVTIGEGAERCVIEFLPASGPAEPLPSGLGDAVVDGATCGASLGLTSDGRLSNGLLSAALVTELNSRIDPRLLNMRVCAEMITVPALPGPDGQIGTADDVPDALNPKFYSMPAGVLESLATLSYRDSVRGLLNLANLALAGMTGYLPVELGEIEAALQTIVTLTHDCALVIECEYPSGGPRNPTGETPLFSTQGTTPVSLGQTQLGGNATNIAVPAVAYLRNPNPVRGAATIAFGMPEAARTRIMVYDVSGRVVASLVDSTVPAGHHTVPLGAGRQSMSTGVYFVRMEARGVQSGERFQHTSKVVVVR